MTINSYDEYNKDSAYTYSTANTDSVSELDAEYGDTLIYSNLSLSGPNVGLGTGSGLAISGYTDLSGGTVTDWKELQWVAPSYFTSGTMETDHTDSLYGDALGYWSTGSNGFTSTFGIYNNSAGYIYEMATSGGSLNDVLLQSATYSPGLYTFNNQITFTANEGIDNLSGDSNVYQLGNNFIVSYTHDGYRADFFLQVQLYDSRGELEYYSTVSKGNTEATLSKMSGEIYNVTSGIYSSPSSAPTSWGVDSAVSEVTGDTNGLHTVTINVNEALLKLIQQIYYLNPDLGTSVLDLSNWSLTTAYIGTESGESTATGDFYVQDPEIHYDTSKTFTTSDTGLAISTIKNYTGDLVGTSTTTPTNADNSYTVGYSTSVISEGYWDSFDLNGKGLVAYVEKGSSFNGNGGSLTESGPGNIYIAGSYSGLYITLNSSSSINAILTGTSNIVDQGGTLDINGSSAGLTFSGTGSVELVGSYSGLVLDNFNNGQSIYATTTGSAYINNTGGNVNITASANLDINNYSGNSYITTSSTVSTYAAGGSINLTGSSFSTSKLNVNGGESTLNVNGSWENVNGSMNAGTNMNILIGSNASIYNAGGSLDLSGNYASLTFNQSSGNADIVGDWAYINATFVNNDTVNATIESGSVDIDSGANVSLWARYSNQSTTINVNGGTADLTYGSNSTLNINVNMAGSASVTIGNHTTSSKGDIFLENATDLTSSYNSSLNETIVSAGNSNIMISGNHNVITTTQTDNNISGLLLTIK